MDEARVADGVFVPWSRVCFFLEPMDGTGPWVAHDATRCHTLTADEAASLRRIGGMGSSPRTVAGHAAVPCWWSRGRAFGSPIVQAGGWQARIGHESAAKGERLSLPASSPLPHEATAEQPSTATRAEPACPATPPPLGIRGTASSDSPGRPQVSSARLGCCQNEEDAVEANGGRRPARRGRCIYLQERQDPSPCPAMAVVGHWVRYDQGIKV